MADDGHITAVTPLGWGQVVDGVRDQLGGKLLELGERQSIAQGWKQVAGGAGPLAVRLALLGVASWPSLDEVASRVQQQRAAGGLVLHGARPAVDADVQRWPQTLAGLKRCTVQGLEATDHACAIFVEVWIRPMHVSVSSGLLVLDPWSPRPSNPTWSLAALAVLSGGLGSLRPLITFNDLCTAAGCSIAVSLPARVLSGAA